MASQQKISERFCAHLQQMAPPEITVHSHIDLVNELGLDSIRLMELIMDLEDEFDISIPINTLAEVRTPWQLAQAVNALMEATDGSI